MIRHIQKICDRVRLERLLIGDEVPTQLHRAFRYIAGGKVSFSDAELETFGTIERQRKTMSGASTQSVDIYYSPKPGSAGDAANPSPGKIVQFDMEKIANHTSVSPYWGRLLHILAVDSGAEHILELGSCAGISGCYLASARHCKWFHTIEASEQLAALAKENINAVADVGTIHNGLFDDILDELLPLPTSKKLDLVWIDGHHEKVATKHYFDRIKPYLSDGALVLFDDISWSYDMRDCWNELALEPGFSHTYDLKTLKGLGVWSGGEITPIYRTVARPLGRLHIGDPAGWKDNDTDAN